LDNVDIEVSNDEEVVSIGIKLKEDSDNLKTLLVLSVFEQLHHNLQTDIHAGIELKHDLHSLLGEQKLLTSLFTEGIWAFAHVKTNSNEFYKTIIEEIAKEQPSLRPIAVAINTFLQKEFNFSIGMDELNLANICGTSCNEILFDTSILDTPNLKQKLSQVASMIKNPPKPIFGQITELLASQFKANFSCSIKLSEFVLTVHFKTSGIKELLEKYSK